MQLILGTVQFGMSYGIANTRGRPSDNSIKGILEFAKENNVSYLDTAISYGESESALGRLANKEFQIISKLPMLPKDKKKLTTTSWVKDQIAGSLKRLQRKNLDVLLLHHADDLQSDCSKELVATLDQLKQDGLVDKVGVSIYDPLQLEYIPDTFKLDVVQCPLNIFDRRFELLGAISKLSQSGTEVHVRSAFLQGLLLMQASKRPVYLKRWKNELLQWDKWLGEQKYSALEVCLSYLKSVSGVSQVIIGVESKKQLEQIVKAFSLKVKFPDFHFSDQIELINPALWKN